MEVVTQQLLWTGGCLSCTNVQCCRTPTPFDISNLYVEETVVLLMHDFSQKVVGRWVYIPKWRCNETILSPKKLVQLSLDSISLDKRFIICKEYGQICPITVASIHFPVCHCSSPFSIIKRLIFFCQLQMLVFN